MKNTRWSNTADCSPAWISVNFGQTSGSSDIYIYIYLIWISDISISSLYYTLLHILHRYSVIDIHTHAAILPVFLSKARIWSRPQGLGEVATSRRSLASVVNRLDGYNSWRCPYMIYTFTGCIICVVIYLYKYHQNSICSHPLLFMIVRCRLIFINRSCSHFCWVQNRMKAGIHNHTQLRPKRLQWNMAI